MKAFLLLATVSAFAASYSANATEYVCLTIPTDEPRPMNATATVSFELTAPGRLSNLSAHYTVAMEGLEESWAEDSTRRPVRSPKFDPDYEPRKYKGYGKIDLEPYLSRHTGDIDLLVPRRARAGTTFRAYLVLTAIDDHFGTTVPLECGEH